MLTVAVVVVADCHWPIRNEKNVREQIQCADIIKMTLAQGKWDKIYVALRHSFCVALSRHPVYKRVTRVFPLFFVFKSQCFSKWASQCVFAIV